MGYQDQIRPASFGGVPFSVDTTKHTFGRRLVTHEYPQRDRPLTEDLGAAVVLFDIQGFVVGPDYFSKRDALITILQSGRADTLIHPYLDSLKVKAKTFTVSESRESGGMATFSMSFIEAGEVLFPSSDTSGKSDVAAKAQTAKDQIASNFAADFSVNRQPDYVVDDAKEKLTESLSGIEKALTVAQ